MQKQTFVSRATVPLLAGLGYDNQQGYNHLYTCSSPATSCSVSSVTVQIEHKPESIAMYNISNNLAFSGCIGSGPTV
jgi:hypothetical protein